PAADAAPPIPPRRRRLVAPSQPPPPRRVHAPGVRRRLGRRDERASRSPPSRPPLNPRHRPTSLPLGGGATRRLRRPTFGSPGSPTLRLNSPPTPSAAGSADRLRQVRGSDSVSRPWPIPL